ncbi:hypothetical protein O0L34_g3694 [Tuta absoluta]|nr:hypothetical protein O0L34_g3694 [Tuta absoluta]
MLWCASKKCISWKWVILWSLWAARLVRQPTPELRIDSGLIRGYVSADGVYSSYLGIPYGTVNSEYRFKAPGPPPKWEGVLEAINENIKCRQGEGNIVFGQEDCLILNVYTPQGASPESKLPVMVYVHGGAFFAGSSAKLIYGPKYLVSKGIILVTINYRLNIQGFLCLRTKDAPGNAAMKDQVAALRWVQRNIKVFGGDPDNVTIFGESAGGAAISYHVLSPMSTGLFHKAIAMSGSSLAAWAFQLRPVYMASLMTKALGYDTEDPQEIYKILMNKTDDALILTRVPRKDGNTKVSEVLYAPCAEIDIEGEEPFFKYIPYEVLTKGKFNKVPMIIGSNSEEGHFIANFENETTLERMTFEESLPKDIVIPSVDERKEVANTLKKLYMDDDEISMDTLIKVSRFHGELYFNLPGMIETELILKTSDQPVYNYLFNYSSWRSMPKMTLPKTLRQAPGATHADDLLYLFNIFKVSFSLIEHEMIEIMTTLWTNFAKYGNPTPPCSGLNFHWSPTELHDPQAMVLDIPPHTQPLWFRETFLYWKGLYKKYRRKIY